VAENLMPTVIFLGTFLLCGGLLIAGLNVLVSANQAAQAPDTAQEIVGEEVFTQIAWTAAPNETVYSSFALILHTKYWSHGMISIPDAYKKVYSYAGKRDVACYLIRDSRVSDQWAVLGLDNVLATDYVFFYQSVKTWGGLSHNYKTHAIPLDVILEERRADTNFSDVDFHLYNYFTARLWTGPGTNLTDGLWNSNFNITLGMSLNSTIGDVSPWGLVGAFLSFRLPNVDPVINLLVAVPVWLALGFLVLTVISRFIPFVPGG
jgi:hypothetical protein